MPVNSTGNVVWVAGKLFGLRPGSPGVFRSFGFPPFVVSAGSGPLLAFGLFLFAGGLLLGLGLGSFPRLSFTNWPRA